MSLVPNNNKFPLKKAFCKNLRTHDTYNKLCNVAADELLITEN